MSLIPVPVGQRGEGVFRVARATAITFLAAYPAVLVVELVVVLATGRDDWTLPVPEPAILVAGLLPVTLLVLWWRSGQFPYVPRLVLLSAIGLMFVALKAQADIAAVLALLLGVTAMAHMYLDRRHQRSPRGPRPPADGALATTGQQPRTGAATAGTTHHALLVDPPPGPWIELPGPWPAPEWRDAQEWAEATAVEELATAGLADRRRVATTTQVLRRIAEAYPQEDREDSAWLHWPDVDRVPAIVTVWFVDLDEEGPTEHDDRSEDGDRQHPDELTLQVIAGTDADRLVEPATVSEVPAPLGRAVRALLYERGEDGTLMVTLRYALHLGAARYARVLTSSHVPEEVLAMQDDLDTFVRSISVIEFEHDLRGDTAGPG